MAYVAPVHRATSVRHALRIRFTSADQEDLILAKANRLEIWRPSEEGLTCLHTKLVYGTIAMLQKLQPKDSDTEMLFVGTDRQQYFTVTWNPEKNQLETVKESVLHDDAEPYMRQSQSQNKCLVDPTGKYMAMHLWEGVLNVFRLRTRGSSKMRLECLAQVRLSELWMKTSVFLHSRTGHPKIAFLYKSRIDQEDAQVAVYRLTKDDKGGDASRFDPLKDREFEKTIADPYASMLIPIPVPEEKRYHVRNQEKTKPHLGGLLVVGETLLTYLDSLTYTEISSPMEEPKIYVAWAQYDETRFILADDYGRLDLLTLETETEGGSEIVSGMNVKPMSLDGGLEASRASSLVYMENGLLFLASHHGDCQVLSIDVSLRRMTLLKTIRNNAPILDFSVMDMGNREGDSLAGNAFSSGQARIVAGCGAYRDGSLRSIRSGVGLDDTGILDEIPEARGLFTVRSHGAKQVDTLVVSIIDDVRVFQFDAEGGIEEVYEFQGMSFKAETLLAKTLSNGSLLQVTPTFVRLLDPESGMALSSWDASEGQTITAASANNSWLMLSVDGVTLVSLNLLDNLAEQRQHTERTSKDGIPDQMSCIHAAWDAPNLGVVGWWASGSISVVDLTTLKPVIGESLRQTDDSAAVPRDLALVQLHSGEKSGLTLLVATEDGNVVTFDVSIGDELALSGRKTVTLGNSAARLHILPQEDGTSNIFATTEHSSLIYGHEGRIIFSATTADDATFVAPFNSEAFPDAIILSTDDHVRISRVDRERLTHVKALPIGQTVRRVAYSAELKAFGLGCIKKELVNNEEVVTSAVKLVDEIIFKELGKPFVLDGGGAASLELVECVIRAELTDSFGNPAERFVVGTSFMPDPNEETSDASSTRGRIFVLGVDEDRQLYELVSYQLQGHCRCLGVVNGYIIAGLSKTVVAYRYTEETSSSGSLEKLAKYRPSAMPVDLDISGSMIGVGDLMQSLTLVEFIPPAEGGKAQLVERARHYQALWTTAVCQLGAEQWLEADAQGNLIVLRRNLDAPTDQDRARLDVISEMNLGEQINRIRRLYVAPVENAVVMPKAFLGSVEGSLYLFGEVSSQYQDLLINFQSNLAQCIETTGDLRFEEWRSFRNEARESDEPFRFLDGEMLERFLDLSEGVQEEVCQGLGPTVEEMRNIVEELRRLH